jgi:DNA-directed RNA polymerase specialized sigma24 family protein
MKEILRAAHWLVERKLVGNARQEAKHWLHTRRHKLTKKSVQAFIDRLESLPDSGAPHSQEKFSDEQRANMRNAYLAGMKFEEITRRFDISSKSLTRLVADLPRHQPRLTEEQRAEIHRLHLRGCKPQQIAEATGVSLSTVYRIIRGRR